MVVENEVHDAVPDDDDRIEFDLDELREQLGIDSILEKLNDLAARFCSDKRGPSTLVQRLKIKSHL